MMHAEMIRRTVAVGAVGLAVALQWATISEGSARDVDAWPLALPYSTDDGAPLAAANDQEYGVRLLESELAWTAPSSEVTSVASTEDASSAKPTSAQPGASTSAPASAVRYRAFQPPTSEYEPRPTDLWPENRDSSSAPIVLNEYHTVTLGTWVF